MNVYVINLEHSLQRRRFITKQLDGLGISYKIYSATYGNTLSEQDIKKWCDLTQIKKYPKWLTKGAIGCAITKVKLWEEISESDSEVAIILEDDIILPRNFNEIIHSLSLRLKSEEVILLYWESWNTQQFDVATRETLTDCYLANSLNFESLKSAGCYMLTRAVAKKLAAANNPVKVGSDAWGDFVSMQAIANIRCLVPSPIQLASFPSDKGYGNALLSKVKRYLEYKIPFIGRIAAKRRRKTLSTHISHMFVSDISAVPDAVTRHSNV